MTERMTDERLIEIESDMLIQGYGGEDYSLELKEALKADRDRIAELEAKGHWIEITDNPATHPPSGKPVMVIGGLPYFMNIIEHIPSISTFEPEKIDGWIGKQWRLLCDLDYPALGDKV